MDDIDRAQKLETRQRRAALARLGRAARSALSAGPSRTHCLRCGEPIPKARRKAVPGCQYCIDCQADMEAHA